MNEYKQPLAVTVDRLNENHQAWHGSWALLLPSPRSEAPPEDQLFYAQELSPGSRWYVAGERLFTIPSHILKLEFCIFKWFWAVITSAQLDSHLGCCALPFYDFRSPSCVYLFPAHGSTYFSSQQPNYVGPFYRWTNWLELAQGH